MAKKGRKTKKAPKTKNTKTKNIKKEYKKAVQEAMQEPETNYESVPEYEDF